MERIYREAAPDLVGSFILLKMRTMHQCDRTAFGYLAEPQSIDDSDSDDHPPAFGPSSIARIPPSPMDDSDSDDQLPARISPTLSRRRRTARRNQFIDSEAGVDGAASGDEDDDDDDDLGGFIVADDVIF